MTSWFVVYTHARAEDRALWHLKNQGFRCFLPRLCTVKRHARKAELVLEPLFPRYLFTHLDLDATRWRAINGTRGVIGLVAAGKRPGPLPDGVVEALMDQANSDGTTPLSSLGVLTKGLRVRIRTGAFAGQTGEIAAELQRGCDRVRVLLNLLGTATSLELPAYAIEPA